MPLQLTPLPPWVNGQILTAPDDSLYEATGAITAKPYCAPFVVTGATGDKGLTGEGGANGTPGQNGNPGVPASINCAVSSDTRRVVFTTTDVDGTDGPCEIDLDECCEEPPPPVPAVTIMKNCSPAGPHQVGDTVNYTFLVANTGGEPLNNIVVTDNVFGAIGTIASLAQGASQTLTYTYTITAADVTAGSVDNVATVTADGDISGDPATSTDSHTAPTEITPAPGISLVKDCDPPGPFEVGDTVTYTFLVSNTGNVALSGVSISDTHASGIPAIGSLAVGQSVTVTGTRVITAADVSPIVNTATVTGVPPTGPTVSDTDTHSVVIEALCEDQKSTEATAATEYEACEVESEEFEVTVDTEDGDTLGNRIRGGGAYPLPNALVNGGVETIPIPSTPAGCILILNIGNGCSIEAGSVSQLSCLGDVMADNTSSGFNAPQKLKGYESDYAWTMDVYCIESTSSGSGTLDLSLPNIDLAGYNFLNDDNGHGGVITWAWTIICRADGMPMTCADLDTAADSCAVEGRDDHTSVDIASPEDCPSLTVAVGRHVQHPGNGFNEYVDSDWTDPNTVSGSATTELYDISSYDTNDTSNGLCQIGLAAFFTPANSEFNYDILHNGGNAAGIEGSMWYNVPIACATVTCTGGGGSFTEVEVCVTPQCDSTYTLEVDISNIDFDIATGDTIQLMPIIDGTQYPMGAVSASTSGMANMVFTVNMGSLAAGVEACHTFSLELIVTAGDGSQSAVSVPAGEICLQTTEA